MKVYCNDCTRLIEECVCREEKDMKEPPKDKAVKSGAKTK